MIKAVIVMVLVLAAVLGGLLVLRRSGRAGMPGKDVLGRAAERSREREAADKRDD